MINRDDAVRLAEQATLGSLLYRPQATADVGTWLRPGDFADLWHAHVYRVIHEHHLAGKPLTAQDLGAQMVGDLGPRRADIVRIHDLLAAAPTSPEPAVYARMVLDAGLRREVAGLGVLMRAGALQSALSGGPAPVVNCSGLVDAGLDSCATRWARATGEPAGYPEPPARLRAALSSRDLRLSADKYLRLHPRRDQVAEHAHEAALVGALIAHPAAIGSVAAWLPPGYVVTPIWRTVYAATVELSELGQPVDLVTVTAATRRLGHHLPCPSLPNLREAVDSGRLIHPRRAAGDVAADQVQRIADNGAGQLLAGADNPGLRIGDLVDTGHIVTGALRRIAHELPHALARPGRPALTVVPELEPAPQAVGQ
ncbi:DnaB-like helicase N-terminal domain-containing protein [uncultured Cellulomonas sp.]|uniref:DnaB-like helicase N-terminal domain-containing protein n=1 Tax=uncultured Cellulomonas sp. TaxID=189682 RepID=UPI002617DFF5|nr:DnaB-like helicase N-terminal domain-containing protein [uncultured Cellulomonas sp.]